MEYRQLGESGLKVSAVGLGGNNFGWWADEQASAAVIKTALEQGVNFFDTADVYGEGRSEEWVGKALKGVRSQVIIATKFGYEAGQGPNDKGGSRHHIIQAVEGSLRRLQTDYIDLCQMHFPDPTMPIAETLRALDDLVRAGKVRCIGCSNFAAWHLSEALWTSRLHGLSSFVSVQSPYNLLNRQIEQALIPCCEAHGVSIITYTPLAAGFLTGKYRRGQEMPQDLRFTRVPFWGAHVMTEENFAALGRLEAFAVERGHAVAELAIAWLLSRPAVSTVIAGATRAEQVMANVAAGNWRLSAAEVAEVDQISQAHLGVGIDIKGTTKIICPWCTRQTRATIPDGAIITAVRRPEHVWSPAAPDPRLVQEMCSSCLAPIHLSLELHG
jgi:aryl-alcohol dehydrogenase-like predicted oxidoreductase